MLLLTWGKGVTGRHLGSPVLQTEARVTRIDALLAAAVLIGLVLIYYALKEGRAAWQSEE